MGGAVSREMFESRYANVYDGDAAWQDIDVTGGDTYQLAGRIDLCAEPALLRRHGDDASACRRYYRR